MIDETTDIQVVKEMIIYLRYIKNNSSMTNFVKIIPLSDGTAETIVHALTQFLAEHNLPVQKMCAIGSDGASVMVGKRNGVVAKLKELVPNLLSNHCVAHRLALAVSQSKKNLPYLKTFKDVLDQVFRFYRNSPVRMAALHEIQAVFDDPIIKPQQAKDVRWLSHDNATRTLAKCLPSVLASLEREAQERGDAQAMGLSVFMQNHKFIASLLMMRDILPHLSTLSKAMQARDAVYTTVQPMVMGTKALLENLKIIPGEHFKSATQTMEKLQGEGFNIKVPSEAQMNDFRCTIYEPFLQNVIDNLRDRFPDLPMIQNYSVFDASCFNEEIDDHGNKEIKDLAQHLGLPGELAVEEWRQVKATITVSKELQRAKADQIMEFLAGLQVSHPNLYKISCVGLLLPTSTADCERGFSTLKRIKTDHRNSLSNKVLNSLLAISINGPLY